MTENFVDIFVQYLLSNLYEQLLPHQNKTAHKVRTVLESIASQDDFHGSDTLRKLVRRLTKKYLKETSKDSVSIKEIPSSDALAQLKKLFSLIISLPATYFSARDQQNLIVCLLGVSVASVSATLQRLTTNSVMLELMAMVHETIASLVVVFTPEQVCIW